VNQQQDILRAAKKLRGITDFNTVYIRRDITLLEWDQWKALVKERIEKQAASRAKEETIKWIIHSGKVVPGRMES